MCEIYWVWLYDQNIKNQVCMIKNINKSSSTRYLVWLRHLVDEFDSGMTMKSSCHNHPKQYAYIL
ncbi:hypothetical protein HanIR_Chr10g0496731 [Helianthus annuus]|nr:hypothetical protein HanIR_Chr10g0496731 [Helianthus annuus]